ncbi:amidase family protein [Nonomuraea jiangxiensis]|uniref:2-dehydropantoate 2-reductase n=1 Tax=Nonomuraea jiangxiensis TaxID=633440 RepID=A0A1G8LZ85_9ACTN|nr:amidase family protein [Nonomuraea jiangxiensis]SDI60807.1 2-dehydropantoate 2-reductase [Nonomuraea jiangxiensis]
MQLTIIGAGAIGGTIGAHMIRAGHDVLLCDADAAHVEAINRDGLSIEGPVGSFTVAARAVTPDELPDRLRHVAIAVKSHHTVSAAELVRDRLDPDGYLVSFQNGLTADALTAVVGPDRLLVSFVNFGADVLGPGRIMQGNIGTFRVGEPTGGEITPRVRELVEALPYAEATGNIMGFLWGKEAYGAMLYAGAVSDLSIADSLEAPEWRPLMLAIAREVLAQSPVKPEGFDGFEPDDLEGSLARLVAFNRGSAKSHSGIYRDLMVRKRKTEVDDLLHDLAGPLTTYTGEIIKAIERGERTCEVANLELLAAYERAERLGRPLNAVVELFHAPLRTPGGPLHGVQVGVKDIIDIAGHPRGNGNPHAMRAEPATADAPVVTALRAAGADVFAATSLLEYAAGANHPDVPEAMNPFNPARTTGGSSGGSAALVGAGVCAVALGTDTGGSIRIPAHYCATVGFKPSHGALPLDGVEPLAPTLDHVGLLARDVATTTTVFAALTGGEPAPRDAGALRVGVVPGQLDRPEMEPDVTAAIRASIDALQAAGCSIVEVDGSPFDALDKTFSAILLFEAWRAHGTRASTDPGHYGPETLRLLRSGAEVSEDDYRAALAERERLLPAVAEVYAGIDVLLTPAAPFVAPVTTPPVDTPEGAAEGLFTAVHNLTGAPALVLPCGWSADGLPIGLQLSSPRGTDLRLLAMAGYVESALAVESRTPAVH